MKSLTQLDNSGKARLLHELFPEEIPAVLEDLQKVCADIQQKQDAYRQRWDFGLVSFDEWLYLCRETADTLKKHKFTMVKNSRVFSDQLTFGYKVLFANDRFIKCAQSLNTNKKFKQMVEILYT